MIGGQCPIVTLSRSHIPLAIFRFTLGHSPPHSRKGLDLATAGESSFSPGAIPEKKPRPRMKPRGGALTAGIVPPLTSGISIFAVYYADLTRVNTESRANHFLRMPSLAKSSPTLEALRRNDSAMLVTPMVRRKPMVAFRMAAMTWGPERLRIRLGSSPIVTSRTQWERFSIDQCSPDPFEQLTRIGRRPRHTGDEVAGFVRCLAVLHDFACDLSNLANTG